MNKYIEIVKIINVKTSWNSDSEFFIDLITKSTIRIIELCYDDLDSGIIIRILPLFRQVHENSVALLGFCTNTLTAKEFSGNKLDSKKIYKRLLALNNNNQDKVLYINEYLKGVKSILNKYAHTNIDGLMLLFMEEHQTFETKKFNQLVVQFLISLVEIIFLTIVSDVYKIKLEPPKLDKVFIELKELRSLRYTLDKLPEGYQNFFENSVVLKDYFRNLTSQFKEQINSVKGF